MFSSFFKCFTCKAAIARGATAAVTVFAAFMMLAAPASAKRVALVMGNGAYQNTSTLPNPGNDARAMAAKLQALGFEVVVGVDQDYAGMRRSVADFAKTARGADIALLFYAGHGMQVRGQNYLIPVDAKFEDETALDFETMPIDFILNQMSNEVKVQMVFLDACRNNPLARSLTSRMSASRSAGVGLGLAEIKPQDTGEGAVIAFATSPGDVALDGNGQNSPFTAALLKHIDEPDATIQNVMTRVTGDVYRETGQRQRPWVNASLIGEVYLNKSNPATPSVQIASLGDAAAAPHAAVAQPAPIGIDPSALIIWEREKIAWESAQTGNTVADYDSYINAYPHGNFVDFARNAIGRLQGAATVASLGTDTRSDTGATDTAVAGKIAGYEGTIDTETSLGWKRDKRRDVQVRLGFAGYQSGKPDGVFGSGTRGDIGRWQVANGFMSTGYFNADQFDRLVQQTAEQYAAYSAVKRSQPQTRSAQASSSKSANTDRKIEGRVPVKRQADNDAVGAAIMGGIVGGLVGGVLGHR